MQTTEHSVATTLLIKIAERLAAVGAADRPLSATAAADVRDLTEAYVRLTRHRDDEHSLMPNLRGGQ